MRFDLCFMGVNALSIQRGLTDIDVEVVEVNRAMLNVSKKNAMLTISEKMNISKRYQLSDLSDIDFLVTELDKDDIQFSEFEIKYPKVKII